MLLAGKIKTRRVSEIKFMVRNIPIWVMQTWRRYCVSSWARMAWVRGSCKCLCSNSSRTRRYLEIKVLVISLLDSGCAIELRQFYCALSIEAHVLHFNKISIQFIIWLVRDESNRIKIQIWVRPRNLFFHSPWQSNHMLCDNNLCPILHFNGLFLHEGLRVNINQSDWGVRVKASICRLLNGY